VPDYLLRIARGIVNAHVRPLSRTAALEAAVRGCL
jgi:hypothetical protein